MRRTDKPKRQPSPSWHELVQPGEKGDPAKRAKREAAGPRVGTMLVENPLVLSRAERRKAHGRGWNPGRLVQHRSRLHATAIEGDRRTSVHPRHLRKVAA